MTSKKEIQSLVYLLDDPDPFVTQSVEKRLFEIGENAVPLLDEMRIGSKNEGEKEAVAGIIHKITFGTLHNDFLEVLEQGLNTRKDLEKAAFTLSRFGQPTLRTYEYVKKLDRFAEIIEPEILYEPDEMRKMRRFLNYFFEELKFRGDMKDYHNPRNACITDVIDRRAGLPITLSLIAVFIARRLNLPFYGVNMPVHFMLAYAGTKEEILFDPYDSGAMVSYDQCYFFLKKNNIEPRPEYFKVPENIDIVIRLLRNLIQSYERLQMPEKVEDLKELLTTAELYQD